MTDEKSSSLPITVGINGFGRMGRIVARLILLKPEQFTLLQVNEVQGNIETAAYMLEFDSTHGRYSKSVTATETGLTVAGIEQEIQFTSEAEPADIKWNVDLVFECTGSLNKVPLLEPHFTSQRVKRVIVSAPVADVLNVVVGCNDNLLTPDMKIVTAASCTTNCAAPIIGAIDKALGIELATLTTQHNVTPTQVLCDMMNTGKKKDLRRGRSGAVNLVPTTTGSAKAVTLIFPHLKGRLDGLAVRVPVTRGASVLDLVIVTKGQVTKEQVNTALSIASEAQPHILGFETRPLVSTDYVSDNRSGIVDAKSTQVVGSKLVKIIAFYDNEWGYCCRMVDLATKMIEIGSFN